jgi:MarR family transcriptional regulator, lower aerobic nicotinate degradation pathway regulator
MNGTPIILGEAAVGTREVLDAVRRLVRALRLSNQEAERRVGLSSAQLFVLNTLGGCDRLALKQIAALTATDQSSVSVVVGRLVKRGLVSRRRSADDGRRLELALTAKGRTLLRGAPARLVQHDLVLAIEQMSMANRRTLALLLARLVTAMGGVTGAPEMFFEPGQRSGRRGKRDARHGS